MKKKSWVMKFYLDLQIFGVRAWSIFIVQVVDHQNRAFLSTMSRNFERKVGCSFIYSFFGSILAFVRLICEIAYWKLKKNQFRQFCMLVLSSSSWEKVMIRYDYRYQFRCELRAWYRTVRYGTVPTYGTGTSPLKKQTAVQFPRKKN